MEVATLDEGAGPGRCEDVAATLRRLRADKSDSGFYVIPAQGLKIEASVWQGGVKLAVKFRPEYAEGRTRRSWRRRPCLSFGWFSTEAIRPNNDNSPAEARPPPRCPAN